VNRWSGLPLAAVCLVAASCAPRFVTLPSGAGGAFPDFARAYDQATEPCRSIRTMAGILAISGRAASERFRAKIDAGFEAPAKVRLELPAPGKPFFTFVAVGDDATLVLPREGRVLRHAPPAATLEALAGVAIGPADLRTIVTGCGFARGEPTRGRSYDRGWVAVDAGAATSWLQQVDGAWRMTAASSGPLDVRYADFSSGRPATIRLRAAIAPGSGQDASAGAAMTDLTIRLSQVDINEPLDGAVFTVDVAPDATPMTLAQLRQAGPLGR
jgi:hypothetical protein